MATAGDLQSPDAESKILAVVMFSNVTVLDIDESPFKLNTLSRQHCNLRLSRQLFVLFSVIIVWPRRF